MIMSGIVLRAATLVFFVAILAGCGGKDDASTPPLICHIGGTMRPVIAELAEKYSKKTGIEIEINSGGSGELLAHIELSKNGDLYVCHAPFADILRKKGLSDKVWTIAELRPVIIVRKGNPKRILGLKDLARKDVELALTDYKLSTLGRMLPTIFEKAGIDFAELNESKRINTNKSGSYVANLVKMGNADAGLVWNVVAKLRSAALDIVPIDDFLPVPGVDFVTSATGKNYFLTPVKVSVATLKCSKNKRQAAKFAEFLASPEALPAFEKAGYAIPANRNSR